jgi:hypothetical protein
MGWDVEASCGFPASWNIRIHVTHATAGGVVQRTSDRGVGDGPTRDYAEFCYSLVRFLKDSEMRRPPKRAVTPRVDDNLH